MKRLILLLFATAPVWAITCSGLTIDEATDHTITFHLQADTIAQYVKARYGEAALTEHTQGLQDASTTVPANSPVRQQITGLKAGTTYLIGASLGTQNVSEPASTYCTELTTSQATTAAAGTIFPTPPTDFDANTEKTHSGTYRHVTACNQLDGALTVATTATGGDVIEIDAALNCKVSTDAPDTFWHFNGDGRVGGWVSGWTRTGNTMNKTSHGFVDGDLVYVGQSWTSSFGHSGIPTPLSFGHGYYVVNSTANTIQLSNTMGGSVITLGGTVGGLLPWLMNKGNSCSNEVLVTTTGYTTGSANLFPPVGVRTNNTDYALATMTFDRVASSRGFDTSAGSPSCVRFANLRFVIDNGAAVTNPDPPLMAAYFTPFGGGGVANHDLIFDRDVIMGANDAPNRVSSFYYPFDGRRMAVVNNYVNNISYWVPYTNATLGLATTQITAVGTGFRGAAGAACPINATVTKVSGSTSGNWYLYLDQNDCSVKFLSDPSFVVTCSGCTQVTSTAPSNFPNSGSKMSFIAISFGTLSAGSFITNTSANFTGCCFWPMQYGSGGAFSGGNEASSGFVGMDRGPGPTKIENNMMLNVIGIAVYWTGQTYDCGGIGNCDPVAQPLVDYPSDMTVSRNSIIVDDAHISSELTFNQKGLWGGRNTIECKWCLRGLFEGNIITGSPPSSFTSGYAFTLTPLSSTVTTSLTATAVEDLELRYNTVTKVKNGVSLTTHYPNIPWGGFPTRRIYTHDNEWGINGTIKWTVAADGDTNYLALFGGYDMVFTHNTVVTMKGSLGLVNNLAFFRFANLQAQNNIFYVNDTSSAHGLKYSDSNPSNPHYGGETGKQALDDVANPGDASNYLFDHNAFVCNYLNSTTFTEMSAGQCDTVRAAYSTLTTLPYWPQDSTIAGRTALVKFTDPTLANYRLLPASPYAAAGGLSTDGKDLGPDYGAVDVAQGVVSGVVATSISATAEDITFTAPDTTGCPVDYSTDNFATWTRVANAGGARAQTVHLTGLATTTAYKARVDCQVQQPVVSFTSGSGTQVADPSFSPVAGTYSSTQLVTISTVTSGASIRYTTDGSTPTSSMGTIYSTPVSIATTTTLKAIAYKSGLADSNVTTGVYTITVIPGTSQSRIGGRVLINHGSIH